MGIAKISVFQGSFMDGEAQYFQVSNTDGERLLLTRLFLASTLFYIVLRNNYSPSPILTLLCTKVL